jgi:ribulose 1,5-bisphosphate synthetase/thiazole synthase
VLVTRAIVDTYHRKFLSDLELDVAVAGSGPSGLMAAYKLAKAGRRKAAMEIDRILSQG